MNSSALLSLVVSSMVVGQLVLKFGLSHMYMPKNFSIMELIKMTYLNLFNTYFITFLFFTLIAGLAWLLVLKRMPLSRAYPFLGINHCAVYFLSFFLFGEIITLYSAVGLGFIVIGTILLGLR